MQAHVHRTSEGRKRGGMADIEVERRHTLGLDQARAAVEHVAEGIRQKVGGEYHWDGDVLHFNRTGMHGAIVVASNLVQVAIRTGPTLRPFRSQMVAAIEQHLDRYLAE